MTRYFAVVPAAGIGTRMGTEIPKQYLPLNGKTVIEHTLDCLLTYSLFEKVIVVLNQQDSYWPNLNLNQHPKIITVTGDNERHLSVLNGLKSLENIAGNNDWILVHDAVRPCLQHRDIDKLINTLKDNTVGGLLGAPIHNTVKQTKKNNLVHATLDRRELWQVFTPQMFRYGLLCEALQSAINNNHIVTDESSAIELLNKQPLLVTGRRDNIKITEPDDLQLAEFYMSSNTQYTEKLFSYGTLRYEAVQLSTFGRKLHGSNDAIVGYQLSTVEISDPKVIAVSGEKTHSILIHTGNPADEVNGVVFDITSKELQLADQYEVADYKRVSAQLHSGAQAWVYVSSE